MGGELYPRLLEAGVTGMSHHYSDLYVPVTSVSKKVIGAYCEEMAVQKPETFKSQIKGEGWFFDVPFAYTPFWEAVRTGELL